MSNPQFVHIETYPLKRSALSTGNGNMQTASNILAEAARLEGHIGHIHEPLAPVILVGQPEDPRDKLQNFLDENKQTFTNRDGWKVERKIAKTTHVLIAAVYSSPISSDSVDMTAADPLFRDSLIFHETEFGTIHLAYKHIDESYLHIHCFTFSPNAKKLHPGFIAKEENGQGAYTRAMVAFQDRFHEQVSCKHDLDRKGLGFFRIQNKHIANVKRKSQKALDEWVIDEEAKRKRKLLRSESEQKALSAREMQQIDEALRKAENEYIDFKQHFIEMSAQHREDIEWHETQLEELQSRMGSYKELLSEVLELHSDNARLIEENKQLKSELNNLLNDDSNHRLNG